MFLLTHFSVIGAVDGKHVRIRKFPNSGSLNWNYKKFNSIILLAFVDHNYRWVRDTCNLFIGSKWNNYFALLLKCT